jgi:hypothetical protein
VRPTKLEELSYAGFASIVLEGKIERGDYEKLVELIELMNSDCTTKDVSCVSGIYLASPGGNLLEALKIGHLVRALSLETHIPSDIPSLHRKKYLSMLSDPQADFMCASACFFIFVAGISRERDIYDPILGIHRPYLSDDELRKLGAKEAMASGAKIRTVVEGYLKEMDVGSKYVDLMFSTPKDEIRFVDDDSFKSDFEGYIPQLEDWLDATCGKISDDEDRSVKAISRKKTNGQQLTSHEQSVYQAINDKTTRVGQCHSQRLQLLRRDGWMKFERG